ncbi:cytochrome C, partial [Candidatus Woesearchaeota archaeon]|nr:cytochrome C [Candidatus Woesearchaeota archaeon]
MEMKKINLTIMLLFVIASISYSQITNSAHDFSAETWNASGEICITCHTPHNEIASADSPLWNHELSTETYTLYTNAVSSTFDATTTQPDGSSKLCLSCHDG